MGERWLHKRASSFKHEQDRAFAIELGRDLFSLRKEIRVRAYVCEGGEPMDGCIGSHVQIRLGGDGVDILLGNAKVGVMTDAESANVAEEIGREPFHQGVVLGRITNASSFTGEFHVRIEDLNQETE